MLEEVLHFKKVRKETPLRVRYPTKNEGLSVDELINVPIKQASKGVWSTCSVQGEGQSWEHGEAHGEGSSGDSRVMGCDLTGQ
jgi:hypothetical protein